jgi:sulfur carrier protein
MGARMKITVNGEATEVPVDLDMSGLIERLGLGGRRIAVEVNQELLPRSRFDGHRLQDGDRVEVIHAVGGG